MVRYLLFSFRRTESADGTPESRASTIEMGLEMRGSGESWTHGNMCQTFSWVAMRESIQSIFYRVMDLDETAASML